MGCASSSAAQPSQPVATSPEPVKFVAGDGAFIQNSPNARLNGRPVVCESYNADLHGWIVKGDKSLAVGVSLGEEFLTKELVIKAAQTTGQSRFNAGNFCNVLRVEAMQQGVIEVDFDVRGDGSAGKLQKPLDSTLGGQTAKDCLYEICDFQRHIKGTLVFPPLNGSTAKFRYGSGGYNFVELLIKNQASNVVDCNVKHEH